MKKLKSIVAALLAVTMCVAMAGCESGNSGKPNETKTTAAANEKADNAETTTAEPEETTINNDDLLLKLADESDINSRLVPPIKNTAPEGIMNKIYIKDFNSNITVDADGRPQEPYIEYDLLKGTTVADIMDNWHSSKGSMLGRYRVDNDMLYFFGEWFGDRLGFNLEFTENGEIVTDGYYDKDENWIKGTYDKTKTDKYIIKGISFDGSSDSSYDDFVKFGGFEDDKIIRIGSSREDIEALVGTGYERENERGYIECYYKNSTMSMFVLYSGDYAARITLIVNETIK